MGQNDVEQRKGSGDYTFLDMKDFDGVWQTEDGEWRMVVLGWLDDKPIRMLHGQFFLDGWVAVSYSSNLIVWQQDQVMFKWRRPQPSALDGPWWSPKGWRNVADGAVDGEAIELQGKWLHLNVWRAASVTDEAVTWEHEGSIVVWHRPGPEALDGAWLTSKGTHRNVFSGILEGLPIEFDRGLLCYGGLVVVRITDEWISWRAPDGVEVQWTRPLVDMLDGPWHVDGGDWVNVFQGELEDGSPIHCQGGRLIQKGLLCSMMDAAKAVWVSPFPGVEANTPEVWRRPRTVDVEGPWKSELGSWHNVNSGVCSDPIIERQVTHTLVFEAGSLRLGGWSAVAMTDTTVTWEENGTTLTWERPALKDISGPWRSTKGCWRNVINGRLIDDEIVYDAGRLVCAGWLVKWLCDDTLVWEQEGDTLTWTRPAPEMLDGPWLNSEGSWRNVEGGHLPDAPIRMQEGRLVYSGWVLAAATMTTVTWEKTDLPAITWRRPRPADLDGPWISIEDGWRTVVQGKVRDVPITVHKHRLKFNGWTITGVTDLSLRWEQAGQVIEWHRPWRKSKQEETNVAAMAKAACTRPSSALPCVNRSSRSGTPRQSGTPKTTPPSSRPSSSPGKRHPPRKPRNLRPLSSGSRRPAPPPFR